MEIGCCSECRYTDLFMDGIKCPRCGTSLISLGIQSSQWNSMTESDKKKSIDQMVLANVSKEAVVEAATLGDQNELLADCLDKPQETKIDVSITPQGSGLVPGICPQCGGTIRVDKSQEAAICEHCGTPFIVEKAVQNYSISNTINIQTGGNVINIGNDEEKKFQNYMQLARRAQDFKTDIETQQKYFTLALEIKPDNWECIFNLGLLKSIVSARTNVEVFSIYEKTLYDTLLVIKPDEIEDAFTQVTDVSLRYIHSCLDRISEDTYNMNYNVRKEALNATSRGIRSYAFLVGLMEKKTDDENTIATYIVPIWKQYIVDGYNFLMINENINSQEKNENLARMVIVEEKIKKYDAQYVAPIHKQEKNEKKHRI